VHSHSWQPFYLFVCLFVHSCVWVRRRPLTPSATLSVWLKCCHLSPHTHSTPRSHRPTHFWPFAEAFVAFLDISIQWIPSHEPASTSPQLRCPFTSASSFCSSASSSPVKYINFRINAFCSREPSSHFPIFHFPAPAPFPLFHFIAGNTTANNLENA